MSADRTRVGTRDGIGAEPVPHHPRASFVLAGSGPCAVSLKPIPMGSTDLLDMFKPRPVKGSSPARATSRAREPRSGGGSSPGTKRLVLGGAVMVLLLALAFTAGVGVGRSRRGGSEAPALARPTPVATERWELKSHALPALGAAADSLKYRAIKNLVLRHPELSSRAFVADVFDKNGKAVLGQFRLVLRDFESRQDAQSVAGDLQVWAVDSHIPFEACRPERMR